jgi:Contractile injection system tube protein
MSTFPGSPKLLKGAIVGVDLFNPLASVILFHYNPEKLTRSVQIAGRNPAQAPGTVPNRTEVLRLKGPPSETISVEIKIDAADQLEKADPIATTLGIHPTLASLEMLLYPKAVRMIANEILAEFGMIEVIAPEAPLTLFVWGVKRVLPVRITGFNIEEQFFDSDLNPIRATVTLSMTVLNYQDLGLLSVGGALFMAHQVSKEVIATIGGLSNVSSLGATASFEIGG